MSMKTIGKALAMTAIIAVTCAVGYNAWLQHGWLKQLDDEKNRNLYEIKALKEENDRHIAAIGALARFAEIQERSSDKTETTLAEMKEKIRVLMRPVEAEIRAERLKLIGPRPGAAAKPGDEAYEKAYKEELEEATQKAKGEKIRLEAYKRAGYFREVMDKDE